MQHRYLVLLTILVLLLVSLPVPRPAAASQPSTEPLCFAQTGECIAGSIRAYWEQNGGLEVFGYPITPLRIETIDGWSGPTQWFERDRLEDHDAQGVLAGRLGVELLELQGRPWQSAFAQVPASAVPPTCQYFAETGHSLCEPFLSYWQQNGGVERFGYPITEPFEETIGTWTGPVQYFERRRMELHLELPGVPVLLGLLGSEILEGVPPTVPQPAPGLPGEAGPIPDCIDTWLPRTDPDTSLLRSAYEDLPFREVLGCPVARLDNIPAAVQRFERGEMLWVDLTGAGRIPITMVRRFIYTLSNPGPTYGRYLDTWVEGVDPYLYDANPPRSDLYVPVGGFGKLWFTDSSVRNGLGWAIEKLPEEGRADVVIFDNVYNDPGNLGTLVLFQDTGVVYAFGRLDKPDEAAIVYPRQAP